MSTVVNVIALVISLISLLLATTALWASAGTANQLKHLQKRFDNRG